jgi:hypothetical protein
MGGYRSGAAIALALFAMGATPVRAQAPLGFYVGGGVGWGNVSVEDDDYYYDDYYWYGTDWDDGEEDTAFNIHVGYRFHPYFAAELAYVDTGKPEWKERDIYIPDLDEFADTEVTLDAHAAQLSGLAILPFASVWEVYARLGISYWWADADQAVYPYAGEFYYTRSQEDEGTSFLFGIGVGASPAPDWNVRFEYQSFPVDEDLLVEDSDTTVDTFLLQIQYRLSQ